MIFLLTVAALMGAGALTVIMVRYLISEARDDDYTKEVTASTEAMTAWYTEDNKRAETQFQER